MKIADITLQNMPQEPSKNLNLPITRQILPGIEASSSDLASTSSVGFNKCLTYQLAMAADVNRAAQERNGASVTSNLARADEASSSDLASNSSVGFNKCLTYQLAMAADVNRQDISERHILRQKIDGLLETEDRFFKS